MGRKKIEFTHLEDSRNRRICFKKRRFGLLKKAMQLAALSNCQIELTVYNKEDLSLMEYFSSKNQLQFDKSRENQDIQNYINFSKLTLEQTETLEKDMSKIGFFDEKYYKDQIQALQGFNHQAFLALHSSKCKNEKSEPDIQAPQIE